MPESWVVLALHTVARQLKHVAPTPCAPQAAYHWWQYELCDVFIELSKPVLADGGAADAAAVQATRDTLWVCLDTGLRCVPRAAAVVQHSSKPDC